MKYKVTTATEALQVFDMLGIKNVSTRRQKKNGTQVYELPIQQMWQTLDPKPLRFACYRSGYIRNVSAYNSSAYQINKTKKVEVNEYHNYYEQTKRILIHDYDKRLVYLANFILKNYYQKPTYIINDYAIKCLKEAYYEQNKTGLPFGDIVHPDSSPVDEIQLIINGHRYNLSEALNEGF
tara:strand:- start:637 stop:1176 length:540 start_codon:yes stop_codon:yes gene_type:complete